MQAKHTASPQHTHPASATTRGHQNPTPRSAHAPQGSDCVRRPGGHGGGTPPDPLPNSDVKTPSAHDTAPQGAGKSVAARSSDAIAPTMRTLEYTPAANLSQQAGYAPAAHAPQPRHRSTCTNAARHTKPQRHTQDAATTAGWSSPVARQAHNLKVTGSNPVPATLCTLRLKPLARCDPVLQLVPPQLALTLSGKGFVSAEGIAEPVPLNSYRRLQPSGCDLCALPAQVSVAVTCQTERPD